MLIKKTRTTQQYFSCCYVVYFHNVFPPIDNILLLVHLCFCCCSPVFLVWGPMLHFLCCNERFWQSSTLSSDNMHLNLEINASTWDHKYWGNHWYYALVDGWCFYNLSIEYYKHRIKTTFCLSCSHMKNSCNYPVLQNSCPRNIFSMSQSNHHCRFTWYC